MVETIFFFAFWIMCYMILAAIASFNTQRAQETVECTFFLWLFFTVLVVATGHGIANTYAQSKRPVTEFVVSVLEVPVTTLTVAENQYSVVIYVSDNKPEIKLVGDIVDYNYTSGTKFYRISERGRFWWMFYILPTDYFSDKNPLETKETNNDAS